MMQVSMASFIITIHGFHNQAVLDDVDIDSDMDEGDQEYTFMSQAGTLTSQTGMTAPYLSYSDNDQSPSQCGYVTSPKHLCNNNSAHTIQCTTSRDSKCWVVVNYKPVQLVDY